MNDRYIMRMKLDILEFDPKNQVVTLLDNIRHVGGIVRDAGIDGEYLIVNVQLINPDADIERKRRRLESCGIELLDEGAG